MDPEEKPKQIFTLLIFKLLHKIRMQSTTYMLSFITFASLLPRFSEFSLQEKKRSDGFNYSRRGRRGTCDEEFLRKTHASPLNNQISRERFGRPV